MRPQVLWDHGDGLGDGRRLQRTRDDVTLQPSPSGGWRHWGPGLCAQGK